MIAQRLAQLALSAALAVACVLFGVPSVAHGASGVEEYRERVDAARTMLETYIERDAEESPGPLVAPLLRLLPVNERVAVGRTVVLADHSTFRTMLARLDVERDAAGRAGIAAEMVAHLVSIERSLVPVEPGVPEDTVALQALLDESQLDARSPLGELVAEAVERLAIVFERWQEALASSSAPRRAMAIGLGVVIALLAGSLAWALFRFVVRLRASTAVKGASFAGGAPSAAVVPAAEGLPEDVLTHAESLAAAGRFAEAVRALFGGAARELADAGLLTRTRTRTNAELLGEVRAGTPAAAGPLSSLSDAFEFAIYGHREPGSEGYARAKDDYGAVLAAIGHTGGDAR